MKKLRLLPFSMIAICMFFTAVPAWAQDDLPPDTEDPDDEPALFIDGLIGVGLIAGAAYAYRKTK